jgi:uncharacterized protein with HEPN domain
MAHNYFQIDIDVLFDALKNDIPPLFEVIKQRENDLLKTIT